MRDLGGAERLSIVGFTISLYEYGETIATLWDTVKGMLFFMGTPFQSQNPIIDFMKDNKELIPEGNALSFLSDDNGVTYNRCHCRCHGRCREPTV